MVRAFDYHPKGVGLPILCGDRTIIGENRQLVTTEPVEFEK
jgi:hypothetical protein